MNIEQNLDRILQAKNSIIRALQEKNSDIPDNTFINDIPTYIENLPTGGDEPSIPGNEIWYTSTGGNIIEPNLTYLEGNTLISNSYENGVGKLVFEKEINEVETSLFQDKSNLTTVTLPNTVNVINENAFRNTGLRNLVLPSNLHVIGSYAFNNCQNLTTIDLKNVVLIKNNAFENCGSLANLTIPKTVYHIEDFGFAYCYGLRNIVIPSNVYKLGGYAFYNIQKMESVKIEGKIPEIGNYTFYGNYNLRTISIPKTVTKIGSSAFNNCNKLEVIECYNPIAPSISTNTFKNLGTSVTNKILKIPANATGYDTGNWKTYVIDVGYTIQYM